MSDEASQVLYERKWKDSAQCEHKEGVGGLGKQAKPCLEF